MKNTKTILATALFAATATLGALAADPKIEIPDSTGFKFTDVKLVKTTPVKDQNKSGTCWSFSSSSFIEDEILRKTGKEVDLSEMWTVRNCYSDKAKRYVRLYGETNFAGGGSGADIFYVWRNYGMMPEQAYSGLNYGEDKHVHAELHDVLSAAVTAITKKPAKRLSTAWPKVVEGILDAYLGEVPETFVYEGKTYTPRSFADALGINPDDYISITSFTHHPYYQPFAVEVPDNWLADLSQNVQLDELKAIVDNALDNGYSVEWSADVSEPGFKWRKGYAVIPVKKTGDNLEGTELSRWVQLSDADRENATYDIKGPVEEIKVTPEMRQDMYDRQETTDDHGMVIIGRAVDQNGNKYYKVKNSWDTNQLYNGYIYVSEPYFLAKTISILLNREAVPKDIAKKIGIK